jgi:hypothetical protein
MTSSRCSRRSFVSRSAALAVAVSAAGQGHLAVWAQEATPAMADLGPLRVG